MKITAISQKGHKTTNFPRYGAPGFQTGGSLASSICFGQRALELRTYASPVRGGRKNKLRPWGERKEKDESLVSTVNEEI